MLIFFTIFVKGIPLVTVVNEQIGGDKYEPSSEAIVVQGTVSVVWCSVVSCGVVWCSVV
jgi:hypothetical protein